MKDSETPLVREFLYVDVDRSRSLLAQLTGGVLDTVRSMKSNDLSADAKANFFGFGGSAGYSHGSNREESRSMQDLVFAGFESVAEDKSLIFDLPDSVRDPESWASGSIHDVLQDGQIARITCDVQILDGGFFASRVERLMQFGEAYIDSQMTAGPIPGKGRNQGKGALEREREAKLTELFGELSTTNMQGIARLVKSFAGNEAAVRLLPCGASHVEYSFFGTMLGRANYMQEERESLFSRYGQSPSKWTVVFQVSAIPLSPGPTEFNAHGEMVTGDRINRGVVESMANALMTVMDSIGIAGGPSWPSISITPLGIYRAVPLAPS